MATRPPITTSFIDKLLSPVPADEEQADTPKFRKSMILFDLAIWSRCMEAVDRLNACHQILAIDARNSPQGDMAWAWSAYEAARAAEEAQCLIPAPTIKELRWKVRVTKGRDVSAEVADAIAADKRRLAA